MELTIYGKHLANIGSKSRALMLSNLCILEISLESREQCGVRQYYRADRVVLPESYQPRVSKHGDSGNGVNKF